MNIDAVQAVVSAAQALTDSVSVRSTPASTQPAPQASSIDILKNLPQARQLQVNAVFGQANLIIYRILDKETGDLILQVPPEQLLQIARSIQESLQAEQVQPSLDVRS